VGREEQRNAVLTFTHKRQVKTDRRAELKDKLQNALDESRILILGAQVLIGFEYRSAFESGFDKLPFASQQLRMGALISMLVALGLLLSPAAYHHIVEQGQESTRLHRFTTRVMELALLPFAVGLGIDLYGATEKVGGRVAGLVAGLAATAVALFFWYGLEMINKAKRISNRRPGDTMRATNQNFSSEGSALKDKIRHALTEARMVLPGAQALLGFQLATVLVDGFDKLPVSSRYVHLASLALVALSTILLIAPAAYHRLVEQGEETEHFHRFASRMVIAAMVPLSLGVSGDFFVVARKVTASTPFAVTAAGLLLAFFNGLWFGFTLYRRSQTAAGRA
jgi:DMSO reductase anchor subunit